MIAAHAIKLGIDVLKPVAEHGRYDLLSTFPRRQLDRGYLIPIADIAGRNAVHLRVAPARNNQVGAVNMANAYELGAVAQLGRASRWQREGRGFESHQLHSLAPSEHEVGAHQFRNHFGYWMERAAAGEEILITRRGRRYARLGPPDPQLATGPDSQSKPGTGR
jgi:prevent-host-death family protein